jgi:hypothetical protein
MEYETLPRMANDPAFLWKGFFICGLFVALAFTIVDANMNGSWLKKGALFGVLNWLLMTPWFEFYLPYNVMNEPLSLVMLEGMLWLFTLLLTGIYMSFVVNFRIKRPENATIRREGGKKIRLPVRDHYYSRD